MKNKIMVLILTIFLVTILPSVYAKEELFDNSIVEGSTVNFYTIANEQKSVKVSDVDYLSNRCKVEIDGSAVWIEKGEEVMINNFETKLEKIYLVDGLVVCDVRIKVDSDDDDDITDSVERDEMTVILTEGEVITIASGMDIKIITILIIEDTNPATSTIMINEEIMHPAIVGTEIEQDKFKLEIEEIFLAGSENSKDKVELKFKCFGGCYKIVEEGLPGSEVEPIDSDYLDDETGPVNDYLNTVSSFKDICSSGCLINDECIPFGTRTNIDGMPKFCSIKHKLLNQKEDGLTAENDYECLSNSAKYGECENIKEQRSIINKIFGWLSIFFGGRD